MHNQDVEMNSSNKRESIDSLIKFIHDLSDESKELLKSSTLQMKECLDTIAENEEKLFNMKNNTNNLFSPNSNISDTNEINSEIKKIEESIMKQINEQESLKTRILNFDELIKQLEDNKIPKSEIGLNILKTQEQDRQRIARDLHDSTVQNLTGLIFKVDLCSKLIDMDPVRAKLELSTMSNTLREVINEIRDIIYDLKPMSLDDLGFIVTVQRYAKQLMNDHNIIVNVNYNDENVKLIQIIKLSLLRVIQEACYNVVKHAQATRIDIDICNEKNLITVSIKDNGIGFDIEKKKKAEPNHLSGYGLSIMKERIYLLSGSIDVHSELKKGTIITVTVPLTRCEGEEDE